MAAHRRSRRRREHASDHADERWLLTYADMLTLMFALFMVLFSISSVNISKYQTLQKSLKAAFSGSILPGGRSIVRSGSESTSAHSPATAEVPAIVPLQPTAAAQSTQSVTSEGIDQQLSHAMASAAAGDREQADFEALKARLEAFARQHGFRKSVQVQITSNGLVINVLTDKLLFASGEATLQPQGVPLLDELAQLLNVERTHPITVAGHTDNQPIASVQFPSNWELSTARATTVVRYLITRGVGDQRLAAAGYADLHPLASNDTASGRAMNRRVEIILQRLNPYPIP